MMITKIISANAPVPNEILTKFKSTTRANSYYNSRIALLKCLESVNITTSLNELSIVNHHYLEKYPEWLVSISHTQNVGAAVIANRKEYHSIGLDIEFADRLIDTKASKFFLTPNDQNYDNLLMLWIKKEAAFKALSFFCSKKPLVLTDIKIDSDSFELMYPPYLAGKLTLTKEMVLGVELLVSIALLK